MVVGGCLGLRKRRGDEMRGTGLDVMGLEDEGWDTGGWGRATEEME